MDNNLLVLLTVRNVYNRNGETYNLLNTFFEISESKSIIMPSVNYLFKLCSHYLY